MKLSTFAALLLLSTAASAQNLSIVNAKAWTLTGDTPIDNATLVITDGKIVSVSPTPPPASMRVIDAGGKIVTPGLMHPATRLGGCEWAVLCRRPALHHQRACRDLRNCGSLRHARAWKGRRRCDLGWRSARAIVGADDGPRSGQRSVIDHAADRAA